MRVVLQLHCENCVGQVKDPCIERGSSNSGVVVVVNIFILCSNFMGFLTNQLNFRDPLNFNEFLSPRRPY